MLKIAIGLDADNKLHSEHFGESHHFDIYEIEKDTYNKVKQIINEAKHHSHEHNDSKKANSIAKQLSDIDILVARAFGQNISKMLQRYTVIIVKQKNISVEETIDLIKAQYNRLTTLDKNQIIYI